MIVWLSGEVVAVLREFSTSPGEYVKSHLWSSSLRLFKKSFRTKIKNYSRLIFYTGYGPLWREMTTRIEQIWNRFTLWNSCHNRSITIIPVRIEQKQQKKIDQIIPSWSVDFSANKNWISGWSRNNNCLLISIVTEGSRLRFDDFTFRYFVVDFEVNLRIDHTLQRSKGS